jgi:hypothetical protein
VVDVSASDVEFASLDMCAEREGLLWFENDIFREFEGTLLLDIVCGREYCDKVARVRSVTRNIDFIEVEESSVVLLLPPNL